jgi:hypothetical protein
MVGSRITSLAFLLIYWSSTLAIRAEEAAISQVSLGLEGHVRQGRWAELRFQAKELPPESQIEVLSRDGDGAEVRYRTPANGSTKGTSAHFVIPIKIGPPQSPITIRIVPSGQTKHQPAIATHEVRAARQHRSTSELIAILGAHEVGLRNAVEKMRRTASREMEIVELTSVATLPSTLQGYECLSRLCIVLGEENPLAAATAEQTAALLAWLRQGGKILFVVASHGAAHISPETPWAALLPGKWGTERELASESGAKSFTGESFPFTLPQLEHKPTLMELQHVPREYVLQWEAGSGSQDAPLIVEAPYGFGTSSWILLDVSHAKLVDWAGLPRLWERVLYGRSEAKEEEHTVVQRGQVTHRGYQDLAGQLRMSLDRYENVSPIHFYGVAMVILAYLCLLGPGEYFALKRFVPSGMQLTWYLLPLLVGGMVAGGIWLKRNTQGGVLRMNHAELLDIDATTGRTRGQHWTGLFTPHARQFSLVAQLTPRAQQGTSQPTGKDKTEGVATSSAQTIVWQALPGNGLGGIDVPALASGSSQSYALLTGKTSPAQLLGLSIPSASSKLFHGQWYGQLSDEATQRTTTTSQLRRGKTRDLEGTFQNITAWSLKNAYLAHGDWMYRAIDDIAPQATVHVERLDRKHLEYQLTQRKVLASSDLATPWNADDTDVSRILEIMMFHQAVGRENYTVLTNHYHSELDLSRLLKQGHAILVGKVATPIVELTEEGTTIAPETTRRWSLVRIVYPVLPLKTTEPNTIAPASSTEN